MTSLRGISTRTRVGAALLVAGATLALGSAASAQAAPSISVPTSQPFLAGTPITIEGSAWPCFDAITVTFDGVVIGTIDTGSIDAEADTFAGTVPTPANAAPGAHIVAVSSSSAGGSSGGGCQASASTTVTVKSPDETTSTVASTVATTVATTVTTPVGAPVPTTPVTDPPATVATTVAPTTVEQEAVTTLPTTAPSTSQALATRLPATGGETDLVPYAMITMATGALLVLATRRRHA